MHGAPEQALTYLTLSSEYATSDNKRDEPINLAIPISRMGRPLPHDLSQHLHQADTTDMDPSELAILHTAQAQDLYKQGR